MATELYLATYIYINVLCSKSVTSCLDTWRTSFNYPTIQRYYFLTLKGKNCKLLQFSYFKNSSWLTYISQLVTFYIRSTRAIVKHALIRKYRQYFFFTECIQYLYSHLLRTKSINLVFSYSLSHFIFISDLFSFILFLEHRVRIRVTRSWSQVMRYIEGHRRFCKDNIIYCIQHILILRHTHGCLG